MNEDIRTLQRDLIEGMTSYMSGSDDDDDGDDDDSDGGSSEESAFDAGYSQEHIDQCAEILEAYYDELSQAGGDDRDAEIMEAVKTAVTQLNALNDETEGNLIETDQREQLCEIIIAAAQEAGLPVEGQDITEEWREW